MCLSTSACAGLLMMPPGPQAMAAQMTVLTPLGAQGPGPAHP
jgi:hypothetical protein